MTNQTVLDNITCPQDGCGRTATHLEEDYYWCNCGWLGKDIHAPYIKEIAELKSDLRNATDLLNDCGYYFEDGAWIDGDNREE